MAGFLCKEPRTKCCRHSRQEPRGAERSWTPRERTPRCPQVRGGIRALSASPGHGGLARVPAWGFRSPYRTGWGGPRITLPPAPWAVDEVGGVGGPWEASPRHLPWPGRKLHAVPMAALWSPVPNSTAGGWQGPVTGAGRLGVAQSPLQRDGTEQAAVRVPSLRRWPPRERVCGPQTLEMPCQAVSP